MLQCLGIEGNRSRNCNKQLDLDGSDSRSSKEIIKQKWCGNLSIGEEVHHLRTLPKNWSPKKVGGVICEYTKAYSQ